MGGCAKRLISQFENNTYQALSKYLWATIMLATHSKQAWTPRDRFSTKTLVGHGQGCLVSGLSAIGLRGVALGLGRVRMGSGWV